MARSGQDRLTEEWATFASKLRYADLPTELVKAAKCLVLDTMGVSIAASTLGDCCEQVAGMLRNNIGPPQCTVLGFGIRTSNLLAGFANGALSHALNFDALGRLGGHVGLAAVPAPLVMAEQLGGVTGKEFLTAVAVAAEFTVRLAASLKAVNASERSLEGQVLSYFGAVVGAGRVLRFTPDAMHRAIGLVLMQAAGSRQLSFEGSSAKAIYGAFPNHAAILSVLMANQGIDGRCAAVEGQAGLFKLHYGGRYNPSVLTCGLRREFFAEHLLFKAWPTSTHLYPFIEASLRIRDELQFNPDAIRRIRLKVGPAAMPWLEPADERRRPRNAATAANSVYFGVAKALANGTVTLSDMTPDGLAQAAALRLCELIQYMPSTNDDDIAVEVLLNDGSVLANAAGRQSAELGFDKLTVKFRDCVRYSAATLPSDAIDELIDRLAQLENETDVGALVRLASGLVGSREVS
jgi:2-methylcitrate dehydratase PrpD